MEEKNPLGIFTNADALSDRVLERLGKAVETVLRVANEESIIQNLTVPNTPDGMEIIFHNQTQDIAYVKPELAETPSQKRLLQLKAEDRLRRWEVRLAVSDEAMMNKDANSPGSSAGDLLSATNAGKAFARAINAEGLGNMFAGKTPVGAGAPWNLAADAQIENDIVAGLDAGDDEGFNLTTMTATRLQMARLHRVANVVNTGLTVKGWLEEVGVPNVQMVKRINYKNNNGTLIPLFNPTGNCLLLDTRGYAVFTQEGMTGEVERDIKIGAHVAYLRKYFRTTPVQPEAAYLINGIGI